MWLRGSYHLWLLQSPPWSHVKFREKQEATISTKKYVQEFRTPIEIVQGRTCFLARFMSGIFPKFPSQKLKTWNFMKLMKLMKWVKLMKPENAEIGETSWNWWNLMKPWKWWFHPFLPYFSIFLHRVKRCFSAEHITTSSSAPSLRARAWRSISYKKPCVGPWWHTTEKYCESHSANSYLLLCWVCVPRVWPQKSKQSQTALAFNHHR